MANQLLYIISRRFATTNLKEIRIPRKIKLLKDDEKDQFIKYRPKIIEDAVSNDILGDFPLASRRLERFMKHYMIPGGKFLRQDVLIYTYKSIEKYYGTYDSKQMEDVHKIAWCLEMYNNANMVLDDIMDDHDIRRGKIAWHKQEDIGITGVSDPPLMIFSMFKLLKKYFSQHPLYMQIIENFLDARFLLVEATNHETKRLEDFTLEDYIKNSNGTATFYCVGQPIELGILLANKGLFIKELIQPVLQHFGFLTNAQNDMLDLYDGIDLDEKPGNDIQKNKFALPIVLALRKASPIQRKILQESYGKEEKANVQKVREIFEEIDIIKEYDVLEKSVHEQISNEIRKIPDDFTRSLMEKIAYAFTFGEVGVSPF